MSRKYLSQNIDVLRNVNINFLVLKMSVHNQSEKVILIPCVCCNGRQLNTE